MRCLLDCVRCRILDNPIVFTRSTVESRVSRCVFYDKLLCVDQELTVQVFTWLRQSQPGQKTKLVDVSVLKLADVMPGDEVSILRMYQDIGRLVLSRRCTFNTFELPNLRHVEFHNVVFWRDHARMLSRSPLLTSLSVEYVNMLPHTFYTSFKHHPEFFAKLRHLKIRDCALVDPDKEHFQLHESRTAFFGSLRESGQEFCLRDADICLDVADFSTGQAMSQFVSRKCAGTLRSLRTKHLCDHSCVFPVLDHLCVVDNWFPGYDAWIKRCRESVAYPNLQTLRVEGVENTCATFLRGDLSHAKNTEEE